MHPQIRLYPSPEKMGSSEIVGSRRMHGARSNFSQTCNLLSQYLKDNGSFGDLSPGFIPTSEKGAPAQTLSLLSMIEKSGFGNPLPRPVAAKEEIQVKPEEETAPMTIFYAGQVIVFNDLPAEKAKEIIALASKSSATQNHPSVGFIPPLLAQSPAESTTSVPNIAQPSFAPAQPSLDSDLPIARKNSLARFLEKRRDRITANAPYTAAAAAAKAEPPPPKRVKTEAWLGLGPQTPFQIPRS